MYLFFFFFKQKTAYDMRISDWSSDVCSSDLSSRLRSPRGRIPAVRSTAKPQYIISGVQRRLCQGARLRRALVQNRVERRAIVPECDISGIDRRQRLDQQRAERRLEPAEALPGGLGPHRIDAGVGKRRIDADEIDRKSTRLNSSH